MALDAAILAVRPQATNTAPAGGDMGRHLFGFNRRMVGRADQGALSIPVGPAQADGQPWEFDAEYLLGTDAAHTAVPVTDKDA